jgi:pimeloyl-ACP methyl ester carboxylesterase
VAITYRVPEVALAYEMLEGDGAGGGFLPGFASDMGGTKAMRLWAMVRGARPGDAAIRLFRTWRNPAAGSSMAASATGRQDAAHVVGAADGRAGGAAGRLLHGRVDCAAPGAAKSGRGWRAMVLIAPAPDFTEELMKGRLNAEQMAELRRDGAIYPPSAYGEPIPMTLKLLEDGALHLLLGSEIDVQCPVRVLHGMRDADVPWELSVKLAGCLKSEDVRLVFVKHGDHRLSRDADLVLLERAVGELLG